MISHNRFLFLSLFLVLFCSLLTPAAYAEMRVVDLEAGAFTRPDLNLKEGERLLVGGTKETVEPQKRLVADLGAKFGIRFSVTGKDAKKPNVVTLLYLTPGIVEKNGTRHDKYTVVKDLDFNAGSHDMAFQISKPYEQVPGIWEFMVFENDRLLIREKFELIAP